MEIEKLVLGSLQTNCYLLLGKDCAVIIDPAAEVEKIFDALPTTNLTHIILTHAHPDHIQALPALKNEFPNAQFLMHQADLPLLKMFLKESIKPYGFLSSSKLAIGNCPPAGVAGQLEIIHTPGHTPGSICLKGSDFLFTGDTLFAHGVGRTDYPFSNYEDLLLSLKKLTKLSGDLTIYPGHGASSTLARALKNLV